MDKNYLEQLNPEQRKAVEITEGPLLVLAGAGAGKTKTITSRILHLIKKGVAPGNILAVTFTNKAAREMQERIFKLLENDKDINRPITYSERPFVSTFHALGVHIIKENSKILGLTRHFSIFDRSDSKKAIKDILDNLNYSPKDFDPGKILSTISREKGNFVKAEEYEINAQSEYFGRIIAEVWKEYDKTLRNENALDFDDLILETAKLLSENEEVRKRYANKFQYIHIDEYQDTNKVQYKIAECLARDHQNICVVGDIDQNIYSWRGANIRNILNFEKDYRGAKMIVLEENYRSTQTILAVANRIIEKNKFRRDKKLVTRNSMGEKVGLFEALNETHEAQFVIEKIKELHKSGVSYSEIAILYRANFQSRVIEEAAISAEIPYHVLGTRFFDRKEVKDILSFLRLSLNRESISDLKRVINVPTRGIGKATLLKIVSGEGGSLSASIRARVENFYRLLDRIKEFALSNPPSKTIAFIAEESGILESLTPPAGGSEEDIDRKENIRELAVLSARYDSITGNEAIEKFLEDTSLVSDQDTDEEEGDAIRLMTVHASKGLEFEYIFVVGLEEGLFPHDRDENLSEEDQEEERRLFYVAITRAKKKLILSYAQVRTIYGSSGVNIPSEFVLEIPDEYLEREYLDYTPRHKPLLHIEF